MAYYLKWNERGMGEGWFMIDQSVGLGMQGARGVNRLDDVMLVQWALSGILPKSTYLGPTLAVNGIYDALTDYYLSRLIITKALTPSYGAFWTNVKDTLLEPVTSAGTPLPANAFVHLTQDRCFVVKGESERLFATMPPFLKDKLRRNVWNGVGNKPYFSL